MPSNRNRSGRYAPDASRGLSRDVLNAKRLLLQELTRTYIAAAVLLVSSLFLTGAAIYGLFQGSFEHLGQVWTAVAFPLGWIVRHYLPGGGSEG